MNIIQLAHTLVGAGLLAVCSSAAAQQGAYPNKPVRLIVPIAAGGPSDAAARTLAKGMSGALGQAVVVENRAGGNAGIGAAAVLGAPADGYTLLFALVANAGLPALSKSAPYRSLAEFTPISAIGGNTQCLVVNAAVPGDTLAEFAAESKKQAKPLLRGSSTAAEDMVANNVERALGLTLERVPYRGGSQVMPDLLAGRVQVAVMPIGLSTPYVRAGRLKNLGCSSTDRPAGLPQVPTLAEGGVTAAPAITAHFLLGPPRLPDDIVLRLAAAVRSAADSDEFKQAMERLLISGPARTPVQTRELIVDAEAQYAQFVRQTGASID